MEGSGTIHMDRKACLNSVVSFVLFWVAGENLITIRRLQDFAKKLEEATVGTVEGGKMTKDLAILIHGPKYGWMLSHPHVLELCNSVAGFDLVSQYQAMLLNVRLC
jgi:isocitrate dehydrogenase